MIDSIDRWREKESPGNPCSQHDNDDDIYIYIYIYIYMEENNGL